MTPPSPAMNPLEFESLARAERDLWWFRGMQEILFRLLDPIAAARDPGRVLEAGCGTGYFAELLQRRYGWKVYPADLAWEGLRRARDRGAQRLARADIASLPFANGVFGAVFCLDVLVHFRRGEERAALAEFRRVLASGGLLVVRAAALDALRSRHSEFACERQRFTRRRLVGAVEAQGFRVVRCTYANSLLMPLALARFRIWEPLLRKPAASGTGPVAPWLNRLLHSALRAERAWIGAGRNLAAGQSLILIGERP